MKALRCSAALGAAALLASAAVPAGAVTLILNGDGILTGATGVLINGNQYDVTLVEGSCITLFGGCDEPTDFDFDSSLAYAAADALLMQVLVDGPQGLFDSDTSRVFGCVANVACSVYIPYAANGVIYSGYGAYNADVDWPAGDYISSGSNFSASFDSSFSGGAVFARFSASSPVPEPASWAMMLAAFGVMGSVLRRSPRAERITS